MSMDIDTERSMSADKSAEEVLEGWNSVAYCEEKTAEKTKLWNKILSNILIDRIGLENLH